MLNEKMSYCLSAQVPFLIITNGILYNVYYSELKGTSQDKLLFDLRLDEKIDEGIISKLKKESFERDDLLKYAQDTFILSNIKKSFESLLQDPSKKFISLLNEKMKELIGHTFGDNDIKDAFHNIYIQIDQDSSSYEDSTVQITTIDVDQKQWAINDQFNNGKWDNTLKLYNELIALLQKEGMKFEEKPTKLYIGLLTKSNNKNFCQIHGQQKGLKIFININIKELTGQEKLNVRDVSNIGHWGTGETEAIINTINDLNWCVSIIKKAYNSK
jgi:predicted transport protein